MTSATEMDRPEETVRSVAVIGLGYVGLPTAAMLASAGYDVTGVDVDSRVVDAVNRGEVLIFEPGLPGLVREQVATGRLKAERAAPDADAYIIAVPTPFRHDGMHTPDISYIESAVRGFAPVLRKGKLVILESTSPVGTTRHIIEVLRSARQDLRLPDEGSEGDVDFAYSPERVIPGKTMQELVSNDRVIGGATPRASRRARDLYRSFVTGKCHVTDDKTAEMVKLAENTFRDVNIALANEFSILCDRFGIDVREMIGLANQHPRVNVLQPGAGVGGHCISVDPWFLVSGAPDLARLIRTARETNDYKPLYVHRLVEAAVLREPGARVACLGLSYKPDIDDFRESPALDIALRLNARWPGRVLAVDPHGDVLPGRDARGGALTIVAFDEAIERSDIVVTLVPHSAFGGLPKPEGKVIIDVVGLWS